MLQADLAAFVAAHDLVRTRAHVERLARQPDYRSRSLRDLTQSAYLSLLSAFVGHGALPVVVDGGEGALSARMADMARAEAKAQKRAGMV